MRDIEFRGRTLVTRRWVYGYYTVGRSSGTHSIESKDGTRVVDPATVGQYTGLTDRNGRRIYEKDIVRTKYGRLCGVSWFSSPSYAGWDLIPLGIADEAPDEYDLYSPENLKVIGNIYDNPELLDP